MLELDASNRGAAREIARPGDAHVAITSGTLLDWMTRPYGADALSFGADFGVLSTDYRSIELVQLAALLMDNGLAPRTALGMVARGGGIPFFWNRREEAIAIMLRGRIVPGTDRT